MIGIALELSVQCTKCNHWIPINAYTSDLDCDSCGTTLSFSREDWRSLLEDAFEDVPRLKEGESSRSSFETDFSSFKTVMSRQMPRFQDGKTPIDLEPAFGEVDRGFIEDPKTGQRSSVRVAPVELQEMFPGTTHLLGEISTLTKDETHPSLNPVSFPCPRCGGDLTVNGQERQATCKHCGKNSLIPKELWKQLHPPPKIARWYLCYNERQRPYAWEGELWDLLADEVGNLYLSHEGYDSKLVVASLDPELQLRWRRDDLLEYTPKSSKGDPKLALGPGERLVLWSGDRNGLVVLSSRDGRELDRLGGSRGRKAVSEGFSMKQTQSLAVDRDGSYLVFQDRNQTDVDGDYYRELLRYSTDGEEGSAWPEAQETVGWMDRLKGLFSGMKGPVSFDQLGYRPRYIRDIDVNISFGADGSLFFLCDNRLARYDRHGKPFYKLTLPCRTTRGRAWGDPQGNAYVLAVGAQDDHFVLKISPSGDEVLQVLPKGSIGQEEFLALAGKELLVTACHFGRLRILGADGRLQYASEASKEEDRSLQAKTSFQEI